MQVDLEKLKSSIKEQLSALEQQRSRLNEGLLTVETVKRLESEFKTGGSSNGNSEKTAVEAVKQLKSELKTEEAESSPNGEGKAESEDILRWNV